MDKKQFDEFLEKEMESVRKTDLTDKSNEYKKILLEGVIQKSKLNGIEEDDYEDIVDFLKDYEHYNEYREKVIQEQVFEMFKDEFHDSKLKVVVEDYDDINIVESMEEFDNLNKKVKDENLKIMIVDHSETSDPVVFGNEFADIWNFKKYLIELLSYFDESGEIKNQESYDKERLIYFPDNTEELVLAVLKNYLKDENIIKAYNTVNNSLIDRYTSLSPNGNERVDIIYDQLDKNYDEDLLLEIESLYWGTSNVYHVLENGECVFNIFLPDKLTNDSKEKYDFINKKMVNRYKNSEYKKYFIVDYEGSLKHVFL